LIVAALRIALAIACLGRVGAGLGIARLRILLVVLLRVALLAIALLGIGRVLIVLLLLRVGGRIIAALLGIALLGIGRLVLPRGLPVGALVVACIGLRRLLRRLRRLGREVRVREAAWWGVGRVVGLLPAMRVMRLDHRRRLHHRGRLHRFW